MASHAGLKKRLGQGVIIGLLATGLALAFWHLGWIETWEAKTWDWRATLLAKPGPATDNIVLILLDQNSLDWGEAENSLSWPWPREVYGAIVDYCRRCGAKALSFDVLFTEDSKYGVEDDAALGDAIAGFGRFSAALFLGTQSGSAESWPETVPRPELTLDIPKNGELAGQLADITFPRATFPIDPIARSAALLSNVQLAPDSDGVYRRVKLLGRFDNALVPSLGLGTYLCTDPGAVLKMEPGKLYVGDRRVPVDAHFNSILRFRGPSGTHRAFSAAAVLQSEIRLQMGEQPTITEPDAFKDKYVLFGFSAPGLYDLRSTPVGGVYPGVEIQATMLDNLLSGDFIAPVPAPWICGLVMLMAVAAAFLIVVFSKALQSVLIALVFIGLPVLLALGSYTKGFWLPLAVQETGVGLAILAGLIFNYATEGRQKRFIKGAFKQYLSPHVIEQLIAHPERLQLGGERRVLTIFFSDLQGFTSISEGLSPEDLTTLLNEYLTAMTDIIHEEGGTVDKYEGDAIIAFWNAPLEVADHALKGVRAALRCQAKLAELRPVFKERIGKDMLMRIGLNSGPAVVGNLGSRTRFDYTMLGDAVNLAARLEGGNKPFGTYTMISDATRAMLGDAFALRELARIAVVGRKEPVTVYEPMPHEEYAARREVLETFEKGLQAYYRGEFEQAVKIFEPITQSDPAAHAYHAQCLQLAQTPPENWQGVWVMTSK